MIIIDLLIVSIIAYSAYVGTKRGLLLVAMELVSFASATFLSLLIYRPFGLWLRSSAGLPISLANIAAYMLIWSFVEIALALAIRFLVLPRIHRGLHMTASQIGGSILNGLKSIIFIA